MRSFYRSCIRYIVYIILNIYNDDHSITMFIKPIVKKENLEDIVLVFWNINTIIINLA